MKTPIVYIVVSDETDLYLQQAILSMHSVRIYNPTAEIILVTDDETHKTLVDSRATILDYISRMVKVSRSPEYNKIDSSRYLKTTLRSLLDGPFLFIDTDTIITDDLSSVDNIGMPIAATIDKHVNLNIHPSIRTVKLWAKSAGWNIDIHSEKYYNSGVMYVSDTPQTREFYENWHKEWFNSRNNDLNQDQPALGKTNKSFNLIEELGGIWNCQIMDNGLPYLHKAKIIHYFASMQTWDTPSEIPFYFRSTIPLEELRNNDNVVSAELHQKIQDVKSLFKSRIAIVAGRNIDFMDTYLLKALKHIYFRHYKIYSMMEWTISLIRKMLYRR